uniref:Hydroxylamine reductase n=1 Tax=Talaromyces marneffei PM1 TaxID=1077442 RepID=A0A093UQA7_TALMA
MGDSSDPAKLGVRQGIMVERVMRHSIGSTILSSRARIHGLTVSDTSNAEQWRTSMDWSKLKRLDLSLPSNLFLETFRGELDGLESLVLRHTSGFWGDEQPLCAFDATGDELRQNYSSFIAALPPLRDLSISGMGRPLNMTPILETHGVSLEKLSIHEFEHDCRYNTGNATWVRPVLSVSEVEEIILSAPNLKELTLDVYRSSNKWPNTMLKTLAKFPHLAQLTLNLDLEDPRRSKYVEWCSMKESVRDKYCTINKLMEPQLNYTTAEKIFQTIRQYQAGTKLRNLTVSAGDFGRRVGGGLRAIPNHELNKPVLYDCWMEENIVKCRDRHCDGFDDDLFL